MIRKKGLDHLIWTKRSVKKNPNGVKKEISEMVVAMKSVGVAE